MPRVVAMNPSPSYGGGDYIGIKRTGSSELIGARSTSLASGFFGLAALLGMVIIAWVSESGGLRRRGGREQPPADRGLRALRGRLGQRLRLEFAVVLGRENLCARRLELGLGRFEVGEKLRFAVQTRDRRRSHEAAFDHVALPMHVADEAAFAERAAARDDRFALIGEASLRTSAHAQPIAVCPDG